MTLPNIQRMADSIRILSADAIERAKSGHPGLPLGMADVAAVLYGQFLKHDPANPSWPDRDRFILSAGHGSMLIYSILHFTGYQGMTLEQIKNFRQLNSLTPGHPEHGLTIGIETTTGPLGQGLGNAVGMAMAERIMNARWGDNIVNHYTYCIVSDGCLMEGLSQEAISLAGHHQLEKLIVFWDSNNITIDGDTSLSVSDDYVGRFESCNWEVIRIDGHNHFEIAKAIKVAKNSQKPSLIICNTQIGKGAPTKEGTATCHGAPLGEEELLGLRRSLGFGLLEPFEIPEDIYNDWRHTLVDSIHARQKWDLEFDRIGDDKKEEFNRILSGKLISGWEEPLIEFKKKLAKEQPMWATRKASGEALNILTEEFPELIGGSADLTDSVNTRPAGMETFNKQNPSGRYINWGIREHGMASAMNGMALHGGIIPYSGTFLSFVDYMRPPVRLASLMKQRVIFVLTHDSIGVGEDGPTHQPTEIIAGLRIIPNLKVYRPCDAVETFECWLLAIDDHESPSAMILTRQNLPAVRIKHTDENLCAKGAYVLYEAEKERDVTLFATGSEVSVAARARELLKNEGIDAAVISMPCWEIFDQQDQEYKDYILGGDSVRVAVEAAISPGWNRYIGANGVFIGLKDFGLSAPGPILFEYFGITAEKVAEAARNAIRNKKEQLKTLSNMLYNTRVK